MLITMGRPEDIQQALPATEAIKVEEQEAQYGEHPRGSGSARKALQKGDRGTLWKKALADCDHPPKVIQKGGNAAMYYEQREICRNRRQRIPMTMVARRSEDVDTRPRAFESTWSIEMRGPGGLPPDD